MPCDEYYQPQQTPEERQAEIDEALQALDAALQSGTVTLAIGEQGAGALVGWSEAERVGIRDTCALVGLDRLGSVGLQLARERAEIEQGRTLDMAVVGSGVHSHDGGQTWGPGH